MNSSTMSSLHPIRLLTRTDAEVGLLVESFFLFKYSKSENSLKLCLRLPSPTDFRNSNSSKMDIVQQGLQMFILERASKSILHELCGVFAVTGSDGTRFFAFFRSFKSSVFVSVSSFPILNTIRQLFDLLEFEKPENVLPILNILCELPIVPAAGATYRLQLSHGSTSIKFNLADQVDDAAMDSIILTVMTPLMLVRAWESVVMERKVLVVSSIDSIITACCEYIRRLVLPLEVVNTYVPLLPPELVNTIEAPFPYLLGANSDVVKDSAVDISETVIIDLDARTVIRPKSKDAFPEGASAPPTVVSKLVHEINLIICEPLGSYFQRPSNYHKNTSHGSINTSVNPFSEDYYSYRCTRILQLFVQMNLSLVSSRHCKVKAFFRRPPVEAPLPEGSLHSSSIVAARNTQPSASSIGYSFEKGVHHGFVHWIRNISISVEKSDKSTAGSSYFSSSSERLPCWLEIDSCSLAVYEQHVDDLPVVYVNSKDITSVSPSPNEPEGLVFELFVNEGTRYLLIATTSEARKQWIHAVDTVMKIPDGGDAANDDPSSQTTAEDLINKDESVWQSENANTDKKAIDVDAQFRKFFMKTQMSNSMFSKLEAPQYESILKETNIQFAHLMKSIATCDDAIAAHLWTSGSIQNILRQVVVVSGDSKEKISHPNIDQTKVSSSRTESSRSIQSEGGVAGKASATTPVPSSTKSGSSSATRILRWLTSRAPSTERPLFVSLEKAAVGGGGDHQSPTHREKVVKTFLRERITSCIQSYRRCQAEINIVLTEDRQSALSPILDMDRTSPGSDATSITIPIVEIADLIKQKTQASYTHRKSQEPFEEFVKSLTPQSDNSCDRSQRWHAFMWYALMGSHWDHDNASANPTPFRTEGGYDSALSLAHEVFASPTTLSFDDEECDEEDDLLSVDDVNAVRLAESMSADETLPLVASDSIIREALLDWIDRNNQCIPDVLVPLSNTMTGYLNERQCEWERAIMSYAKGGVLVDHNRVMVCIVNQFAAFVHCEMGSGEEMDDFTKPSSNSNRDNKFGIRNDLSFSNSVDQDEDNDALSSGMEKVTQFLVWANGVRPIVGLHAYRFLVEMLYQFLLPQYDRVSSLASGLQPNVSLSMYLYSSNPADKTLALGSFRSFPGKHGTLAAKQRMAKLYRKNAESALPSVSPGAGLPSSRPMESISHSRTDSTEFTWADAEAKSDVLNELVTCIAANEYIQPCEFSTELLSRVRELLRTYCQNLVGTKLCKQSSSGQLKAKITSKMSAELAAASAFTTFELQCCQLQKIDVSGLSVNQRTLFFCNVFNTLTVHAIIRKGNPGSSMLERSAFMRSSKYNLNGMIFSLLDIEHGILRNSSTKAMVLGPLTMKLCTFPDRDPRKGLALEEPKPLISFCLYDACVTSPVLVVLRDANRLNEELLHHARNYLLEHVRCEPIRKTIELPGLIRIYWADFGNNKLRVLKMIMKATGLNLLDQQAKIEFAAIDWTPLLTL